MWSQAKGGPERREGLERFKAIQLAGPSGPWCLLNACWGKKKKKGRKTKKILGLPRKESKNLISQDSNTKESKGMSPSQKCPKCVNQEATSQSAELSLLGQCRPGHSVKPCSVCIFPPVPWCPLLGEQPGRLLFCSSLTSVTYRTRLAAVRDNRGRTGSKHLPFEVLCSWHCWLKTG